MPIETKEQAGIYLDTVHRHLDELTDLSVDAGLYSHAAIWCALQAAFYDSTEEIKTIVDMIGMYLEAKTKQYSSPLPSPDPVRNSVNGDIGS